jgi:hypothetical protein
MKLGSQAHINALGKRKEHQTQTILAGDSCCTAFPGSCQSPCGNSKIWELDFTVV